MNMVMTIDATEFERELRESETPLLVEFFAPGCCSCQMLAPFIEEMSEHYAGQVKVVSINLNEEPALANRLRIRLVPTLVAFWHGQEVDRVEGLPSPYNLNIKLAQLAQLRGELAANASDS